MKELYTELTDLIKESYETGVTLEQAERIAAKFLYAQIMVSQQLQKAELDARMRKSGLKTIKAAVYMKAATAGDKKPSDTLLQNIVDLDDLVQNSQKEFDSADVEKETLQNYFNIFKEAHIYFRGIAKGRFE